MLLSSSLHTGQQYTQYTYVRYVRVRLRSILEWLPETSYVHYSLSYSLTLYATCLVIYSSIWTGGSTPINWSTCSHHLNIVTCGILLTLYLREISAFASSSTFTFTTVIFSQYLSCNWSRTGPSILHGPHRSAQKSTKISHDLSNWVWSSSVHETLIAIMLYTYQ